MWEVVRNIGSGLSLVAFAIAMIGIVYRARLKTQAKIIKDTTSDQQVAAIAINAAYFNVNLDGLEPIQKQRIVLAQIDARTKRDGEQIRAALIVGVLLALIVIVSIIFEKEPKPKLDLPNLKTELLENTIKIQGLSGQISSAANAASGLLQRLESHVAEISQQQLRLDRGEGSPKDRADAIRAIQEAKQADDQARAVLSRYESQQTEWVSEKAKLEQRNTNVQAMIDEASR